MKKFSLMMLGAALTAATASAQYATQPASFSNICYTAMSPNGMYAAGSDPYNGSVTILNMETKAKKTYKVKDAETEWYELGTGVNSISDTGVVLMSTTYEGTAGYAENGVLYSLPLPAGVTSALANAITPDGSRIAGSIGIQTTSDADEVMQRPVIWERQADGTYAMPVELPYPKTDFTGRLPQYVLADGISADGKRIACNIIDYSGMAYQPLVLEQDAGGEWQMRHLAAELINPDNLQFPDYPGESPYVGNFMTQAEADAYNQAVKDAASLKQPLPKDFMTPENRAAYEEAAAGYGFVNVHDYISDEDYARYLEAVDAYYAALYPEPVNYMTPEHREAYLAAMAEWQERFDAFDSIFQATRDKAVEFEMNALTISQNGRFYAIAGSTRDEGARTYTTRAYVFDLETGKTYIKDVEGETLIAPAYVTDDGKLLAAKPASRYDQTSNTFVTTSLDSPLLPLQAVAEQNDESLYDWMKSKMVHKATVWDDVLEEDVTVEQWITGSPSCDAKMRNIMTWALNSWSGQAAAIYLYSYFLPTPFIAEAVNAIAAPEATASSAPTAIYNIDGSKRSNYTNTKGIYILQTPQGAKKIVK